MYRVQTAMNCMYSCIETVDPLYEKGYTLALLQLSYYHDLEPRVLLPFWTAIVVLLLFKRCLN